MTEVHQFIPSFVARDAMGAHVVQVQRVLRAMGIASEIHAADIGPGVTARARPYRSFARRRHGPDTWILYQFSTGSPMTGWILDRPEPKILNYHNITPSHLLAPWHPAVGVEVEAGRRQLARLAPATELAIAVSQFNEKDLVELGFARTAVVPLFADLGGPEGHSAGAAVPAEQHGAGRGWGPRPWRGGGVGAPPGEQRGPGRGTRWLFVGRLVPNKCHHDLIKALAAYRRVYDPDAELALVGKPTFDTYTAALRSFAAALGLGEAVRFEGSVSPAALAAHYTAADVLVCLSEHEGFCAPLLEAMLHEVPIVAFAAGAVPETLDGAGIVLEDKSPLRVAAAVHLVRTDDDLRRRLVARGRARAADFEPQRVEARFRQVIGELLASPPPRRG